MLTATKKTKRRKITNRKLETIKFMLGNTEESPIRYEKLDGREHLVAPCVMLTEGVHEGSGGSGFYSSIENAKSVPSWNHKPVVVYHPEINGQPVSACDPTIINKRRVGIVLKTSHDNKLRTEVWLDIKKTNKVDARIIPNMKAGKMMEVSTGLFARKKKKKGVWNGEKYEWEAKDYAPDHLALLPDQVGACSIMDGAGLLQTNEKSPEILKEAYSRALSQVTKILNEAANDMSFAKIMRSVELAVRSKLTQNGKEWQGWIEEIFSDFVIYYAGGSLYKQTYKAAKEGIELTGSPKEVKRMVSYQTVDGAPVRNTKDTNLVNNSKGSKRMKLKINRRRMVNNLIGNGGGWTEGDRDWLMNLDAKKLVKLARSKPELLREEKPAKKEEPVANTNKEEKKEFNYDSWLKTAPPKVQAMFNQGIKRFEQEQAHLIKNILDSKLFGYSKEELETKEMRELSELMKAVKATKIGSGADDDVTANWEGNGGAPIDNRGNEVEEEPLMLPQHRRSA